MADIKWIKVTTDMFSNRKIRQIEKMPSGKNIIVVWLKLMLLAGQINDDGQIYLTKEIPYTDEMMAREFDEDISIVRIALETFARFGMIELVNDIIHISNWARYQNVDGMDRVREQTRKRVANYRAKRLITGDGLIVTEDGTVAQDVTLRNVTDRYEVTLSNAPRIDKNIDIDKEKDNTEKESKRFIKPTVEEVAEYVREKGYHFSPEAFVDFYESKGWMVGKNHMKDWKSTCRNWERSWKEKHPSSDDYNPLEGFDAL